MRVPSAGSSGSRHLSGRRLDPMRSNFESINLGKSPANQQIRYKLCMEQGQDAGSLGKMQRESSQCMLYNELSQCSQLVKFLSRN